MINIAFVIESFTNKAGMERVLAAVANAISEDVNVTIITANQNGKQNAFELCGNINRIDLGVTLNKKVYKHELEKFLMKNKFDVVVSLGGLDSYFITGIKDGSKKVLWYHFSFDYYKALYNNAIVALLHTIKRNLAVRKFDLIVALNERDCIKWRKINKNVIKIYNPISLRPNCVSQCNNKRVIAVGRLDKLKGFDLLIDAYKIVSDECPEWKLEIYGQGELKDNLHEMIHRRGLDEYISLCGSVVDIEDKYLNSSLLVCSSRSEAFGLMMAEAECFGLPIVAFDCPSSPKELISDGENGFVVPLGNVQEMANAIVKLLKHDDLRKRMGARSVELSKKYDVDNVKNNWILLFFKLLNKC